jgi:hypothetical protein
MRPYVAGVLLSIAVALFARWWDSIVMSGLSEPADGDRVVLCAVRGDERTDRCGLRRRTVTRLLLRTRKG